jgi:hypothetical protein
MMAFARHLPIRFKVNGVPKTNNDQRVPDNEVQDVGRLDSLPSLETAIISLALHLRYTFESILPIFSL